MAAVLGGLQGHAFLPLMQSIAMGIMVAIVGLAVGPGDMQAVYPPHSKAAGWVAYSPGCDWISTAHPARPRRGRGAGWEVANRPKNWLWLNLQSGGRKPLHDQQPMSILCREICLINRAPVARNLTDIPSRVLAHAARVIPTLIRYLPRVRVLGFESF